MHKRRFLPLTSKRSRSAVSALRSPRFATGVRAIILVAAVVQVSPAVAEVGSTESLSLFQSAAIPTAFAQDDVMRIDFGTTETASPDASGSYWNNLTQSPIDATVHATSLLTTDGAPRDVYVEVTDPFEGVNLNGVVSSSPFPQEAFRDSWWTGSFDGHEAGLARPGQIVVGNLPTDLTYRVRVLASRTGLDAGASRSTRYTLNGQVRNLEAADNAGALATFSNVRADSSGKLTLTVAVDPDEDGRFAYLNALELSTVPPVFPGAEGFGTRTPAGRGGSILRVTNLNANGPGSLKAALETAGPRTVIFDVGGVIDLGGGTLRIREPFITVAGATAPPPGITLIKGQMLVETHDVLVQHISIRAGDAPGTELDCMSIGTGNVYNVVIDRCSFTWGIDENISVSSVPPYPHDVTISNCIIAEGLSNSVHSKGEHSKGTLIGNGTTRVSLNGNLYAHNYERSPRLGWGTSVVMINNLIYNPGYTAVSVSAIQPPTPVIMMQGNHCIKGASSRWFIGMIAPNFGEIEVWEQDNLCEELNGNPAPMVVNEASSAYTGIIRTVTEPPIWPDDTQPRPVAEVLHAVTTTAGMRAGDRDPIDTRIVSSAINRTGIIIDSQDDVGGYPAHAMVSEVNALPSNPHEDPDGNGYTVLEEWIHAKNLAVQAYHGSYASWAYAHFRNDYGNPATESTLWGTLANPDNDPSPNWSERVQGTSPLHPNLPTRLPAISTYSHSATIAFSIDSGLPMDSWDILQSNDLKSWISAKNWISAPEFSSSLLQYQYTLPGPHAPTYFRLIYTRSADE